MYIGAIQFEDFTMRRRSWKRVFVYSAIFLFLNLLALVIADALQAQPDVDSELPLVIKGPRIHTAAGASIERGVMVVHKGKIIAIGPEGQVQIPAKAVVRDLSGKTII